METELMRQAERLHAQLLAEARAAIPGTGARRKLEKEAYSHALFEVASRVRDWIFTEDRKWGIAASGCVIDETQEDLWAAEASVEMHPRETWRKGWARGLRRGLDLAISTFGGSPPICETSRGAVDEVAPDPEKAVADAEAAFFREAERALGPGKTDSGGAP